jgi:MFS family permease
MRLLQYAGSAILVRLSDEGARVALGLLAVAAGLGTRVGGLLIAVLLVPHVVAAPAVGAFIDRSAHPVRRVAVLAAGFAVGLGLAGVVLGRGPLALVVLVLLLAGCCGPALTGGLSSVLPELVRPEKVPRAFGVDGLTYNVAGIGGPALAAVIAGAWNGRWATEAVCLSAAAGAVLVAALPLPARGPDRLSGAGDLSHLPEVAEQGWSTGVRAIARDRLLRAVTVATTLGMVGAGALPVVATVVAVRAHHPPDAGLLLAAEAVGGLVGSLLWTARPAGRRRAPLVVAAGLVGVGVPLVLAAATGSLSLRIALFALAGLADGPAIGALLVVREDRAPVQARSQVFTVGAGAKVTAAAAGAALGGLVSGASVGTQLLLAGGLHVVAGLLGLGMLAGGGPDPASLVNRRTPR